jgi:hypothetical protein
MQPATPAEGCLLEELQIAPAGINKDKRHITMCQCLVQLLLVLLLVP